MTPDEYWLVTNLNIFGFRRIVERSTIYFDPPPVNRNGCSYENIQSHSRGIIPEVHGAFSSYPVVEAMNASPKKNMNGKKNKSKEGEMPSKGSQGSNGKVNWPTVRYPKEYGQSERGKISSCLNTLQQKEKNTPDFKDALDYMWDHYYRLVAPDKASFCEHLGLTVPEAEALLNRANLPASKTAPSVSFASNDKHASETATARESRPNVEKHEDTQAPNHEPRDKAHESQPVVPKPAPASQSRSSKKEKKSPSNPPRDTKAPSEQAAGEKTNSNPRAGVTNNPAPESISESPGAVTYEDHPLAAIFPLDDGEPLDQLADDIRGNGLREPIVLFEGKILDGRRRYRACLRSGTPPVFFEFEGSDPAAFVLSKNIHRRNLEKGQRAAIAAELLVAIEKEARERKDTTNGSTRDNEGRFSEKPEVEKIPPTEETEEANTQAAASERQKSRDIAGTALDVNPHYVSDAKAIMENAPDLHEQLKQGKITMSQAKRERAKRNPEKQSTSKNESKVEWLPFTVILWDESGNDAPIPAILKDKKKRKSLASAVVFHLTPQPKFALGSEGKDGFCDAALFVIPVNAPAPEQDEGLVLQKPSCLFLVARTCGDVPKPEMVVGQLIEGGAVEARKKIEKMWPSAPRHISNGDSTPPEGWQVS
jgi:ParB-like chromosome segregation protein Spo0J